MATSSVQPVGSLCVAETLDRGVLETLPLLQFLPPDVRTETIRKFVPVSFPFGSLLAEAGTYPDAWYVLVAGRARVLTRTTADEIPVSVLSPGDTFGEAELCAGTPSACSVRASTDVLAQRLDAEAFRRLLEWHPDIRTYLTLQLRHARLQAYLPHLPAFVRLVPPAMTGIALADLEVVRLNAQAVVYRQGEPAGPMYLIEAGQVRVMRSLGGRTVHMATLGAGESFGIESAWRNGSRSTTVEAVTAVSLRTLSGEALGYIAEASPSLKTMIEERALNEARVVVPHGSTDQPTPCSAAPPDTASSVATPLCAESDDPATARRRRRVPFIRQVDETDCGAACLAMVGRAFGRRVSLAHVRRLVNPGVDGASLQAICRAAEELGLAARSVKTSDRHLDGMPLPAIVHGRDHHWMVLADVSRRHVRVVDPTLGSRRLSRQAFGERWSGYVVLFDYTPAFAQAPQSTRTLAWLWPIARPHRSLLFQAVGLAGVVSLLQMMLPVFTQVIVDRVLVDQDLPLLQLLMLATGVVMVFIVVSLWLQRYFVSYAAVRIDAAALDFLTQRLLALPLSYFTSRKTGDLQRRLEGLRHVRDVLLRDGIAGLTAVAQLAATVALIACYSPRLTLVFLATAPLYALLMVLAARWLRRVFVDLEDAYSHYHSFQIDAVKGIETVKSVGGESAFRNLLLHEFLGLSAKVFRADFSALSYEGAVDALTFAGLGLFLWAGAHQVLDGTLSIGGLVAINSLVALSSTPLRSVLLLWDDLQRCGVLLDRLDDVLEHEPEQGHDRSRLRAVRTLSGSVTVRGVGFRYGGPETPSILEGVTLDVPAGTVVAVVGRSGSGKTTLAKCLAGLREPTSGTILYDGLDLTSLNYRDVRRQIGVVLQDCYLFADTIARNIAFGEEEPDMEQVAWAAEVAHAHEFIERLPFGYDTRVGETGLALSGGQRQRIAIARAIYHRPPILIFDEATSSLDAEAERAVQQNLRALLQGRTAFVIAHRVSTVQQADLIVVLEGGRLIEQGRHDSLMQRRGLYHSLVSQQLEMAQ